MNAQHFTQIFAELRQGILAVNDGAARLDVSRRAEQLLDQLDAAKSYEAGMIAERVLGIEATGASASIASGEDIRKELVNLIDAISAATITSADVVSEPVLTVDEVARRWNVSAKTISRWRNRGLVARTF